MSGENRSKTTISIDGRTDLVSAESGYTLGKILGQLSDYLGRGNRVVVSARADGKPVSDSENAELLDSKVEEFALVELETVDVRSQAATALREVRDHLPQLSKALVEVTESIQAGEIVKGYKSLAACADLLNLVVHVIDEVRVLVGIDLTAVRVNGSTVSEQMQQVRDVLRDAKAALDNQDIVAVADLMEYELAPRITGWEAILNKLLETVAG
jgi:hypothetical protein